MRAQLRAAKARTQAAQARARAASQALARLQARYDRAVILNRGLGAITALTVLVSVWAWRAHRKHRARLEAALKDAQAQLDDLPEVNARLTTASAELTGYLARMAADHKTMMALRARIRALEADAAQRAITSGELQLETLEQAARLGEVVAPCPVLNGEEQAIAAQAKAWASEHDLSLHPQMAMRGFLEPRGVHAEAVLKTFNSKRCDMVLLDANDRVALVIEHHGSGHEQDDWAIRDKVKRRLLNLARVGLVVTREGEGEAEVRARLAKAWRDPAAAIPPWPEATSVIPGARRHKRRSP